MILESDCRKRQCVHYEGVKRITAEDESTEVHYCIAFPNGIPAEISYDGNLHEKPLKDQSNSIVYEKE